MSTTTLTATVIYSDSNTITLHMKPTPPLCLSQITIDLNTGVTHISGICSPGDPRHGGSRTIQADQTDFNRLSNECPLNATVLVSITYDSNFNVSAIDCGAALRTQAEVLLMRISDQIGAGVVDAIRDGNEIANQQLLVQRRILQMLEQQSVRTEADLEELPERPRSEPARAVAGRRPG